MRWADFRAGGLVISAITLLLVTACSGGGSRATATPTPATTATTAPSPPTATVPAATATPSPTAQDAAVAAEIVRLLQAFTAETDKLGPLLDNPRIIDATWRADVRDSITRVAQTMAALQRIMPPVCMEAAYAELLKFARTAEQWTTQVGTGLTNQNLAQINATRGLFEEAGVYLKRSTDLLRQARC
jgi:hypothetical protein